MLFDIPDQTSSTSLVMLTESKISELITVVRHSLDRAEELWSNTLKLNEAIKAEQRSATNIPGHPYLKENEYVSDYFIALMVDMRESTTHLRQAISQRIAKVSQMQRVYYEVSALLPAMAKVIQDENGAVTEYLGDGALALFQVPQEKGEKQNSVIYAASWAARKCLDALEKAVNPVLYERYGLPKLKIGIGMAYSDAIITRFGLRPQTQIKVIGQCIYFASSLAKEGKNEIFIHEYLENLWPTSKDGILRFTPRQIKDFKGYLLSVKE